MAIPKRWINLSQNINHDSEVWELTSAYGDRALRLWIEMLAVAERSGGLITLTAEGYGHLASNLAKLCRMNSSTVRAAIGFMLNRGWLYRAELVGEGESRKLTRSIQDVAETAPRRCQDGAKTTRRTVQERAKTRRKLVLIPTNYWKFHRKQVSYKEKSCTELGPSLPSFLPSKILEHSSSSAILADPDGSAGKPTKKTRAQKQVLQPDFKPDELAELYVKVCSPVGMPRVQVPLSDKRRRWVLAALKQHGTREFWESVFKRVVSKKFLQGHCSNGRSWTGATFVWLVQNPENALKVYEGNYDREDDATDTREIDYPRLDKRE